jgi:2-dehydro-3-deoxyphosphogluconate aldolase/(4S)-4-hydroxy-2-oxoglutarate aldolase
VIDRVSVLQQIESTALVGIIRASASAGLSDVLDTLFDAGLTCMEITMTTPDALDVIHQATRRLGDRVHIGVGSVLDSETARAALLAGAQFIVSPTVDESTIQLARRYGAPILAGAFTPTEILRAWQAGADLVKVFPATQLGPNYFKEVLAPMPQLKLVPTGGVRADNVADYLRAGAVAVAAGSALVSGEALLAGDLDRIGRSAAEFVHAVRAARSSP